MVATMGYVTKRLIGLIGVLPRQINRCTVHRLFLDQFCRELAFTSMLFRDKIVIKCKFGCLTLVEAFITITTRYHSCEMQNLVIIRDVIV